VRGFRVFSGLALLTILKFQEWAEDCIARQWTCWKLSSKAGSMRASRQKSIPRTPCTATLEEFRPGPAEMAADEDGAGQTVRCRSRRSVRRPLVDAACCHGRRT